MKIIEINMSDILKHKNLSLSPKDYIKEKENLVDQIIFQCKLSNITHGEHIPLDKVFVYLAGMTLSELRIIAQELNIKTE